MSKREEWYRMFFDIHDNSDEPFELIIADFKIGMLKIDKVDPMNFFNLNTKEQRKFKRKGNLLNAYKKKRDDKRKKKG